MVILSSCIFSKPNKKEDRLLGTLKVSEIRKKWALDSCGSWERDTIITILEKSNALYGLPENEIYYLFGEPHYSAIRDGGKLLRYRILGGYNTTLKRCDPSYTTKSLFIVIDTATYRVKQIDLWEE